MHWLNIHLLNRLQQPAAIISLCVELGAIISFTLLFREAGASHNYELELFWSYKAWILGKSISLGMEILSNIILFFPLGFVLTLALRKCPFRALILIAGMVSSAVELSQFLFKLGLFRTK